MGADLYWKITPLPIKEEYNGFHHSSWVSLADALNLNYKEDLSGVEFTKQNLTLLNSEYVKADRKKDNSYKEDLIELMDAINEHGSITLEVRN